MRIKKRHRLLASVMKGQFVFGVVMLLCAPGWCETGLLQGLSGQPAHVGHDSANDAASELGVRPGRASYGSVVATGDALGAPDEHCAEGRCCQAATIAAPTVVAPSSGAAADVVPGLRSTSARNPLRRGTATRGPPGLSATPLRC